MQGAVAYYYMVKAVSGVVLPHGLQGRVLHRTGNLPGASGSITIGARALSESCGTYVLVPHYCRIVGRISSGMIGQGDVADVVSTDA
jgi:hypothetical protein